MKLNKEQFSKTVLDVVGPLIERVREQQIENQKKLAEEQAEFLAQMRSKYERDLLPDKERIDRNTLKAARFLRLLAAGKGDPERAVRIAKEWGDDVMVKVMGEATLVGGGALVPEELAADVIELLRAKTVVRKAGAQSVPINHGTLSLPYLSSGSTAYYKGESEATTESTPQFGQLVLTARDLSVLVAVSNQLLRDSSARVDVLVRDDMVETARVREDLAFIRGTGFSNTPKGLRYWAATVTAATDATPTVGEVTNDLGGMMQRMEDDNVPLTRLCWIMNPTVKWGLKNARVTQGPKAWPEMDQGELLGVPFFVSSQLPSNLGGSANESELILVDMAQVLIGESDQMELSMSDSASYTTGGSLVSAFARGETVMKLDMRHDLGCRFRGTEVQVLNQVVWGNVAIAV